LSGGAALPNLQQSAQAAAEISLPSSDLPQQYDFMQNHMQQVLLRQQLQKAP
jgi:hypothetical protein